MNRIIKIALLPTFFCFQLHGVVAQNMTLNEALIYAQENSIAVAIQEYNNNNNEQNKKSTIASMFPYLSTSAGLSNSYGRSIDPETNVYTTIGSLSNSYSLSTSVTIFSGLSKVNAVKASKITIKAGQRTLKQIEDQNSLEVMQLFFDVIYCRQSVELIKEQLQTSEETLRLVERQVELGIKSKADRAIAESELASYEMMLTQAIGNLDNVMLELKIAMNYPMDEDINPVGDFVVTEQLEPITSDIKDNINVQLAQYALDNSVLTLKTSRNSFLPSLSLYAGIGSSYFTKLSSDYTAIPFNSQIKSNFGFYVGGSLSFTIFNGLNVRSAIITNTNNMKVAQLMVKETENQVLQAMETAILQRKTSYQNYVVSKKKIAANELAYKIMKQKYEQGMVSIIELQKTSNDLLISKSTELKAALDYQIQCIMIDYYNNKPLMANY